MIVKILISVLFILSSCGSLIKFDPTQIDPKKKYRKDMIVTVDGVVYEGFGVLPQKSTPYKFHVEARGDLDLFTLGTCVKELPKEKAWGNVKTKVPFLFWNREITSKREVEFEYSRDDLERRKSICRMELVGINATLGKHSFATFDFESPDYESPIEKA